jgi:hypothetical protein
MTHGFRQESGPSATRPMATRINDPSHAQLTKYPSPTASLIVRRAARMAEKFMLVAVLSSLKN